MIFYYIRHGSPIYNPDSLTPLGKRQAEAVGKRLAQAGIDEIYASSSNRAIETAKPLSELLGKEINILDWCNEGYAWQEFTVKCEEGTHWVFHDEELVKLLNSPELINMGFNWYDHPAFAATKCKAGMERVGKQTSEFLGSLGYRYEPYVGGYEAVAPNDKHIALFAHEGFSKPFLSCLLGIPCPIFMKMYYNHSGVTAVKFDNKNGIVYPRVLVYSDCGHLYREGLPMKYNGNLNF